MSTLIAIHRLLGVAVLVVAATAAVLVLVASARPRLLPMVRAFVRLCVGAAGVQVVVGLLLLAVGSRPAEALHLLYGAATVAAVPIAAALGRGARRREQTYYLLGGVVLMALLAVRAITTGSS